MESKQIILTEGGDSETITISGLAIQAGCDIGTISKVLGHSSIATTSLYVHSKNSGTSEYL